MENSEIPKRRGWSIVGKAQIVGALFGTLFTIGMYLVIIASPPKGLWDFSGLLMEFIMIPAILIAELFGKTGHWFIDDRTGNAALFPNCLVVMTNLILGFLIGTFVGLIIQKLKKKN